MFNLLARIACFVCLLAVMTANANGYEYVEKNTWQLGIAFGLGVKTNPLVDGDDIPLVILPDIAWYGEKAYFDNGELGYQWLDTSHYKAETFVQLDSERAFFSFFHPANIFVPESAFSSTSPSESLASESNARTTLSVNDIARRKWALNAGIRWHYIDDSTEWRISLQHDLTNVHKGHKLSIKYLYNWQWNTYGFNVAFGADWKSKKLVDYYYGIDERDTADFSVHFEGAAGWQPSLSVSMIKPINANWSWLSNFGYQKLPSSMTDSPLVERSSIQRFFLGVAYRF